MPCFLMARRRPCVTLLRCCSSEKCALDGRYQPPLARSWIFSSCCDVKDMVETTQHTESSERTAHPCFCTWRCLSTQLSTSVLTPPNCMDAQVLARHEGAKTLLDVMDLGLADEASASLLWLFGHQVDDRQVLSCTSVGPSSLSSLQQRGHGMTARPFLRLSFDPPGTPPRASCGVSDRGTWAVGRK